MTHPWYPFQMSQPIGSFRARRRDANETKRVSVWTLQIERCPNVPCPESFPKTEVSAHLGQPRRITHSWIRWGQATPRSSAVLDLGTSRSPCSKKLMSISCGKMVILLLNYPEHRQGVRALCHQRLLQETADPAVFFSLYAWHKPSNYQVTPATSSEHI